MRTVNENGDKNKHLYIHTCGGGCCSYGRRMELQKDLAIGKEKEKSRLNCC